ncbi:MAG: AAA family ATPase [Marinifilaceae bacterium]|jgi:hypothetical protein|nr:AAA family ATPase [Marinifilaceae bacterium]
MADKQVTEKISLAKKFITDTNTSIFLTGKAGTGKTTLVKEIIDLPIKRKIIVAPTGVAALNAGGVTIHSMFQLPFGPIEPDDELSASSSKMRKSKIKIIKTLDLLIIDEISMVRADVLDGIDKILRTVRKSKQVFGGVQVLMVGDLQQLPPIVKDEEWDILKNYYKSMYFFESKALKDSGYVCVELDKVFRQKDEDFVKILNAVRDNNTNFEILKLLNQQYIESYDNEIDSEMICLTTHNSSADEINYSNLEKISSKAFSFDANVEDSFPEHIFPTARQLSFKKGAQVMFLRNDSSEEKKYYNGKIGIITGINEKEIVVKCKEDNLEIIVHPERWENIVYKLNEETMEMEEEVVGSFTQYPLKLAWAITIHKSQGLSFDQAYINISQAWSHGQAYVALSRCRSLDGLVLGSKVYKENIICDSKVVDFNKKIQDNQADWDVFDIHRNRYSLDLLKSLFDFDACLYELSEMQRMMQRSINSVSAEYYKLVSEVIVEFENQIVIVGNRFINWLYQTFQQYGKFEGVDEIDKKLKSGANYFLEKVPEILDSVLSAEIESERLTLEKKMKTQVKIINELLYVKNTCLKLISSGFDIDIYIETRSKALLEAPNVKNSKPKNIIRKLENKELYIRLRNWRELLSKESNISISAILSNSDLINISNNLPVNRKELIAIKGFGKVKADRYSVELCRMVNNYISEMNIDKN